MNHSLRHQAENLQNQYGLKLSARLSAATAELPYDVSERLRAARERAVAQRKLTVVKRAPVLLSSGGAAVLGWGDDGPSWWQRLVAVVPLVVLALGLVGINMVQSESRVNEVAEIDAALLTDDLPPSAYADPGFVHFLKVSQEKTE